MNDESGLSPEELAAEGVTALPDKEVVSILDLNVDLDLALDVAAPIDLAVAANANVAAPINAAASANLLSDGSTAQALGDQGAMINQGIVGDATASAEQDSTMDQGNDVVDGGASTTPIAPTADGPTVAAGPDGELGDTAGGVTDGVGGVADGGLGGATDGVTDG